MKKIIVQIIGFGFFVPIMLSLALFREIFKALYEMTRDSAEFIADISLKMRSLAYAEEDAAKLKQAVKDSIARKNGTLTRYEVHGKHFATYEEAKKYLDWVNEDKI